MTYQSKPGHITIALSVFNGAATIESAVRSLLKQSYESFDLFVVDDGSTDRTFSILESMLPEDKRLHVIRSRVNNGTYSAKNLVLKSFCHGEFFAHQDADDHSWHKRLESQVRFLKDYPQIAACGTGIDEFFKCEAEGPTTPSDYEPQWDEASGCFHRKNLYEPKINKGACFDYQIEDLARIKIAMNGSMLFRTNVLNELGGFDGRTRLAGDTELFWRILAFYPIGNLQQVLYSRRFHKGSLTKSRAFGFGSELRAEYAKKIKVHMMRLQAFYDAGNKAALVRGITQDMYVAESPFHVYHGGLSSVRG